MWPDGSTLTSRHQLPANGGRLHAGLQLRRSLVDHKSADTGRAVRVEHFRVDLVIGGRTAVRRPRHHEAGWRSRSRRQHGNSRPAVPQVGDRRLPGNVEAAAAVGRAVEHHRAGRGPGRRHHGDVGGEIVAVDGPRRALDVTLPGDDKVVVAVHRHGRESLGQRSRSAADLELIAQRHARECVLPREDRGVTRTSIADAYRRAGPGDDEGAVRRHRHARPSPARREPASPGPTESTWNGLLVDWPWALYSRAKMSVGEL